MAKDKYLNAKCFVLSDDGYEEITYSELCHRLENSTAYQNKKFLPLHGMLMEVTSDVYQDFYKAYRRQKYLTERSIQNRDISIDMLSSDEFNGQDVLSDESKDVVAQAIRNVMIEKLKKAMALLPDDEQLLIYRHYYSDISETELAKLYGVSQQAISKKLLKIRKKLKSLLDN